MKIKRRLRLLAIIITVMTISIAVQYGWDIHKTQQVLKYNGGINGDKPEYKITVEFKEETMRLKASQKVVYTNRTDVSLNNIYFHIYPNVFKTEELAPFEKSEWEKAYPKGFDEGYININQVKENKKITHYRMMGDSLTLLRVSLNKTLKPKEQTELFIDYEVQLPYSKGRMGYGENTVNITNWFPILSVYDQSGWNLDPYFPIGDPFYSEVGNYEVTIILPKEYILASTGDVVKKQERQSKNTYLISAHNVRNFAMIISKKFDVKIVQKNDIEVRSYSINGIKGDLALQYGVDSLEIFNDIFGGYPYNQLSIVASDFFIGGMEYPNLVMIGQHLYEREEDFPLEYVIAHEIAHQWWYGVVGNNEVKEPWLDEGLTEYSTLMYFERKYGPHIKEQIYEKMIKNQFENYEDLYKNDNVFILRGLDDFNSSYEYSSLIYSRGAIFIEELRKEMGDDNFFKALSQYYHTFRFRNVTTTDFYKTFQNHTNEDLRPLFKDWLNYKYE